MMTTIEKSPKRDCLVLPYLATSEAKAQMFADAIEALFCPGVEVEVFEDGGTWGVAVVKGMDRIDDPLNNAQIVSAFTLVMLFDLEEGTGDIDCVVQSLDDIPPLHKALAKRARRTFRIEDELNRIGFKLDAVLAALIGSEATKNLSL
jgi:hypothetical protein